MTFVAVAVVAAALAGGEPATPKADEAFFGRVTAEAPAAATEAELYVGNERAAWRPVRGRRVVFRVPREPGRYDVRVRFERDGALVRRDEARRVWLLPSTGARVTRPRRRDATLARRLEQLGRGYDGYAALWAHDLRTGRTASWNADASFPAASLVKLGVLVAALERFGPRPERSEAWRDIRDLATWSSNLATNRLLVRLGGSESGGARIAQQALHRLGATSSTFTGFYRLGTGAAADRPRPLPVLTYRRTTARDVGRILLELHAAAAGERAALRRTGLSLHEARVGLALLLSSARRGENAGLLRPRGPAAQKHGWTTNVQHTAAVLYEPSGPKIVVLLTFRPDEVRLAASAALGARLLLAVRSAW